MCEICGNSNHLVVNANEYDPTHTTTLRNLFNSKMDVRFNKLCAAIKTKIVTQDFFEFNAPQVNATYPFTRSVVKVQEFMDWLKQQINDGILSVKEYEQLGESIDKAWTNLYITDSYKRGIIRARYELQKAGLSVPSIDKTGGIEMSMFVPLHMDTLGLLFTRVFTELKGITNAMSSQIAKVLTQGLADGDGMLTLANKLVATINGTGMGDLGITDVLGRFIPAKRRAMLLSRTEIVRAHHQAMIQEYRNWGVLNITVLAEIKTAGDDRVCDECSAVASAGPYSLDEAFNLLPVHPLCRCVAMPYIQELIDKVKNFKNGTVS